MKIIFYILIGFCFWTSDSRGQTDLILTNGVPIGGNTNAEYAGFYGMAFGLSSHDAFARTPSFEEALQITKLQLDVDEQNCIVIYNTTTNRPYNRILVPSSVPRSVSAYLCLTVKTTNGIPIPRTDAGKAYDPQPKHPYHLMGESANVRDLPKLTDLFKFPSTGEYILEARLWWWNPKDKLTLTEPVRLKIIARNIDSTNSVLKTATGKK